MFYSIILLFNYFFFITIQGCTNLLINKEISSDGSNIIAYNADASNFYTTIYHYPATKNNKSNMTRKMWTWE